MNDNALYAMLGAVLIFFVMMFAAVTVAQVQQTERAKIAASVHECGEAK